MKIPEKIAQMINELKNLPPLPASILKIQELCSEPNVNISQLVEVIEKDPMLSANILKSVNSPLYGMSKEIVSIRQAVTLFGPSMIRGFAVSSTIKKSANINLNLYGIAIDRLGDISILQMALIREWYERVDKSMLQPLMADAFLMELGKLLAAYQLDNEQAESFLDQLNQGKSIDEVETAFFGKNSYALAAIMFEAWNFEEKLTQTLNALANPYEDVPMKLFGSILYVVKEAIGVREVLSEASVKNALIAIHDFQLDKKAFEEAVEIVRGFIATEEA